MLKELAQDKVNFVGGGRGCSCCCKRNPPVIYYEGIVVEYVDSGSICLHLCNTRKDSLGYMSCIGDSGDDIRECSELNNTDLAARIDRHRIQYPRRFLEVNTKNLRKIGPY